MTEYVSTSQHRSNFSGECRTRTTSKSRAEVHAAGISAAVSPGAFNSRSQADGRSTCDPEAPRLVLLKPAKAYLFSAMELLQGGDNLVWLQPFRIVGIDESFDDLAMAVNDKGAGHGEFKVVVALRFEKINSGITVEGLQILGELKDQAPLSGSLVADVAEDFKGQLIFFDGRQRVIGQFRGNGYKRRAGCRDLRQMLLQSIQLQITVGSPATAVKTHHQRAMGQQSG